MDDDNTKTFFPKPIILVLVPRVFETYFLDMDANTLFHLNTLYFKILLILILTWIYFAQDCVQICR